MLERMHGGTVRGATAVERTAHESAARGRIVRDPSARERTVRGGAAIARLSLFVLCACAGQITTPELETDELGNDGVAGAAGRSSVSSAGSASAAGAGGSGASGRSGAGGREPAPPASGDERADAGALTNPPPHIYCDAPTEVFKVTCGNGSCHSNRGAVIGDFAVGPEEAASYVSRGSVRDPTCGLIIDPREPKNSLILTKVNGQYPSDRNCGGAMPVGSVEITDEQIDCIADWVEQFRE
jgi:hypothetical protein